jgi:phosphoribosyl 1,2-cyclic phosphodiesterase
MSLFIASLNSGSNGNCYYVGNHSEAVLIDAGISCRETEKRMSNMGLDIERVKAIFISHEHSDHISGLQVLAKKYRLPVYISAATLRNSGMILPQELIHHISAEPISIGALCITAFEKFHDAADPYSFIIEASGVKIGVLTDIGKVCKQVVHYFRQCHGVFLESNYDEQMLEDGGYPLHLKRRIRGGMGHLSNVQALQLFKVHRSPFMSHLILSHLSKNNNHPEKALDLFSPYADELTIVVASRHCESAVYHVQHPAESFSSHRNLVPFRSVQYSLFE